MTKALIVVTPHAVIEHMNNMKLGGQPHLLEEPVEVILRPMRQVTVMVKLQ